MPSSRRSATRPALTQSGPRMRSIGSGHRKRSRRSPGRRAGACAPTAAATAATTSAHSPNALKWTRKKFASWAPRTCCFARSSPLQAQKRRDLALPVLYRSGAPEEIRTPDPQIRRLTPSVEPSQDFCKPDASRRLSDQRVSLLFANRRAATWRSTPHAMRRFGDHRRSTISSNVRSQGLLADQKQLGGMSAAGGSRH